MAREEQARNSTDRYHNRTKMNAEALRATGIYILRSGMEESTVDMALPGMIVIYIFCSFVVDMIMINGEMRITEGLIVLSKWHRYSTYG